MHGHDDVHLREIPQGEVGVGGFERGASRRRRPAIGRVRVRRSLVIGIGDDLGDRSRVAQDRDVADAVASEREEDRIAGRVVTEPRDHLDPGVFGGCTDRDRGRETGGLGIGT